MESIYISIYIYSGESSGGDPWTFDSCDADVRDESDQNPVTQQHAFKITKRTVDRNMNSSLDLPCADSGKHAGAPGEGRYPRRN